MQIYINKKLWLKLKTLFLDYNPDEILVTVLQSMDIADIDETLLIGLSMDYPFEVYSPKLVSPVNFLTLNEIVNISIVHYIAEWEKENGDIQIVQKV